MQALVATDTKASKAKPRSTAGRRLADHGTYGFFKKTNRTRLASSELVVRQLLARRLALRFQLLNQGDKTRFGVKRLQIQVLGNSKWIEVALCD